MLKISEICLDSYCFHNFCCLLTLSIKKLHSKSQFKTFGMQGMALQGLFSVFMLTQKLHHRLYDVEFQSEGVNDAQEQTYARLYQPVLNL